MRRLLSAIFLVVLVGCTDTTSSSPKSQEWRVVTEVHDDGSNGEFGFYAQLAASEDELEPILQDVYYTGDALKVDFETEIVLAFATWHGSGCKAPFADLTVNHSTGVVTPAYDRSNVPDICPTDVVGYATLLAIRRSALSAEQYVIEDSSTFPGLAFKPKELS